MRTSVICGLGALTGAVALSTLGGCGTNRTSTLALADSEIRFTDLNSSVASAGDWRMTGDAVGLWMMGDGQQSPMVFALAADGSPEFIAGDSLGMLLVTGDVTAIANVLETGELD